MQILNILSVATHFQFNNAWLTNSLLSLCQYDQFKKFLFLFSSQKQKMKNWKRFSVMVWQTLRPYMPNVIITWNIWGYEDNLPVSAGLARPQNGFFAPKKEIFSYFVSEKEIFTPGYVGTMYVNILSVMQLQLQLQLDGRVVPSYECEKWLKPIKAKISIPVSHEADDGMVMTPSYWLRNPFQKCS